MFFSMTFYQFIFTCCLFYSVIWPSLAQLCPPFERPVECMNQCQSCKWKNGGCVQPAVCIPGCDCFPGWWRNDKGVCVPADQCPECPLINCLQGCDLDRNHKPCPICVCPACPAINCVLGCELDRNHKPCPICVCPENCGPNEIYSDCVNPCNTCDLRNVTCNFLVCNKGCDCAPGFTRNEQGICIPENLCPVKCGPNSKPNCVFCEPTCKNPNPVVCPQSCIPGCECDPGFIKDDYGNCIQKHQCPKPIKCGPNSKPSDCVFCEPTCKNPKPEVCAQSCAPGCECNPGFIKDDYGNCIPKHQCPKPIKCGPNSEPSDCVFCEPTCKNPKPEVCAQSCAPGCKCNPGFIKDDRGNCIPKHKCPKPTICGSHSSLSDCASRCPPTCRETDRLCITLCEVGCVCDPGYILDDYGKCIPKNQCPKPGTPPSTNQQCPLNEYPVGCIDRCQRCEFINKQCFQIQSCEPGCNCLPGYLRNKNNACIPAAFCPAPTNFTVPPPPPPPLCPPNEYPVPCVNRCQKCEDRAGNCGQGQWCIPGCNCLPGFWRNKQGRCIPEFQCPPLPAANQQCPPNEYPVPCINRCQKCEDRKGGCNQIALCTPGCDCVPTFWRNKEGRCIPEFQCPGY